MGGMDRVVTAPSGYPLTWWKITKGLPANRAADLVLIEARLWSEAREVARRWTHDPLADVASYDGSHDGATCIDWTPVD